HWTVTRAILSDLDFSASLLVRWPLCCIAWMASWRCWSSGTAPVAACHSCSVMANSFPNIQIDHPAPADVWPRPATVAQDLGVGDAGFIQGVGQQHGPCAVQELPDPARLLRRLATGSDIGHLAEVFVVLIVAALALADGRICLDELDGTDPLDHLEAELVF